MYDDKLTKQKDAELATFKNPLGIIGTKIDKLGKERKNLPF